MNFAYLFANLEELDEIPKKATQGKLFYTLTLFDAENQYLDGSARTFLKTEISKVPVPSYGFFKEVVKNAIQKYKVVDFGAILLFKDSIFASVLGGVDVKILRGQKLVTLGSGGVDTLFLSGKLLVSDLIIMASKIFFNGISDKLLIESLADGIQEGLPKLRSFSKAEVRNERAFFVQPVPYFLDPHTSEEFPTGLLKVLGSLTKKLRFKLPQKAYLKKDQDDAEETQVKNKVSGSVGIILTALLVVSILFGTLRKNQLQKIKIEEEVSSLVEHKVNEARSIFDLNPVRSRELVAEARLVVDSHKESGSGKIDELIKKVENAEREILGDYKKHLELFFDLTLFSEGFSGNSLKSFGKDIYVFDKNEKKVVSIDTESKRSEIVAGPSVMEGALEIIPSSPKMLYLHKSGISNFDGKKLVDKNFEGEVLTAEFLGSLYLLDKKNSQILKYKGELGLFGGETPWLSNGETVDLTQATDINVDGFLWILLKKGEILKMSQGKKTQFGIKGVNENDFGATALYTNADLKYLYILDSTGGKMIVVSKDGKYKAQYSSETLKGVSDLLVYEKSKKAYFLSGEKLLYLDLDHL